MEIDSLNKKTIRVTDFNIHKLDSTASISPNCGLNCYLVEAYIKSESIDKGEDSLTKEAIKSLLEEAQPWSDFNGQYFWGWEKSPTIDGIKFPFDWDDTAKAIDCLRTADAYRKVAINTNLLPNDESLNKIFKSSIFETNYLGVENKIYCPYNKALFVFFGPGSEQYKGDKRDDPMVTIATIRMLAQFHPKVILKNKVVINSLIKRAIFTLNYILKNEKSKFSQFSRYYFSLAHYAFRLFETLDLLSKLGLRTRFNISSIFIFSKKPLRFFNFKSQTTNNELIAAKIKSSYESINSRSIKENDNFWWYLLGLKTELITVQNDFQQKIENYCNDRIIYQHRRLNHQYYSPNWEKILLITELNKHNLYVHKNNLLNFNGLRYLKKSTVPVFALVSFIVFALGYWFNQSQIIRNLNIEAKLHEPLPNFNTVLGIFFFMVISLKLYIQAWAVEETYLTNRIIAPIDNVNSKQAVLYSELITRFAWTLLIMLFPILYSLELTAQIVPWYLYIGCIFSLIIFWDFTLYFGFNQLYKKLDKNIGNVKIFWFLFDLIMAIFTILISLLLFNKIKFDMWETFLFLFLILGVAVLSIFQIYIFSSFIFSNKITYKYDS